MKTIELSIDDELLTRVNQTIAQQKTTLAAFIRESFIHYLNRLKIRELEKQSSTVRAIASIPFKKASLIYKIATNHQSRYPRRRRIRLCGRVFGIAGCDAR